MKLSAAEIREFIHHIQELMQSDQVHQMESYIQHGKTTTLTHCIIVSYYSFWLSKRLPLKFNSRNIARGALLHDFYLYDWHIPDDSHKLHGFVHPGFALSNAKRYFSINSMEADIIEKHMWPMTITKIPGSKEALLVCLTDKICSLAETFHIPIIPEDFHQIKQQMKTEL